ncbi:flavin monooxygenase-like protein [Lipomyces kononenkoae]|uniref:Flavin monooxygenase-like protein n=1 Tax=Lipomyces kononenkoae TaxID=34357 RepID=A0ACC3SSK2_LIPKO
MGKQSVAVIGAGAVGLATLKNLLEEDFDVTAYDKRQSIGGVWDFNENINYTSTLPATTSNVSKFKNCFTDFPIPDDMPVYLTSSQVHEYLQSYATQFDLYRHIRLNTMVRKVVRSADNAKWQLHLSSENGNEVIDYDKVVFCSGLTALSHIPEIRGIQLFKGKVLHSQAFKRPTDFAKMKVLVVGLGNSAVDTCTQLVGHAEKIYVSHRHGINIFPRICKGQPLDFHIRRRDEDLKHALTAVVPSLSQKLHDSYVQKLTTESFDLDPAWRIHPPPSILTHQPTITDSFINCLQDGSVASVVGIRCFVGDNCVELDDGSRIEADAVILCTGYVPDFNLMHGLDVTSSSTISNVSYGSPFPRLYQNIFSPEYPESIAFLNNWAATVAVFPIGDLASMAIAQVWKGAFSLPSKEEMHREIDAHHSWLCSLAKGETVYPGIIQEGPWMHWLHDAAGTGVNENLGYGFKGWFFWLRNPQFCNLLMGGLASVHVFRLFNGRRKKWDEAKAAILRANENAKLYINVK